jgi:hypothetical protein
MCLYCVWYVTSYGGHRDESAGCTGWRQPAVVPEVPHGTGVQASYTAGSLLFGVGR